MSRLDLQGFLLRTFQGNSGEYIEVPNFQDFRFRACRVTKGYEYCLKWWYVEGPPIAVNEAPL